LDKNDDVDIGKIREIIRGNTKASTIETLGYYETKQHTE